MVVSPFPYAEIIGGVGYYLRQFLKENPDLDIPDRPYIYYLSASDLEDKFNKNHVNINKVLFEILSLSKYLNFNYKIQYYGRNYYNKLNFIPYEELLFSIMKEIKFVKPNLIFIPTSQFNPSTDYVNKITLHAVNLLNQKLGVIQYPVEDDIYWEIYPDCLKKSISVGIDNITEIDNFKKTNLVELNNYYQYIETRYTNNIKYYQKDKADILICDSSIEIQKTEEKV